MTQQTSLYRKKPVAVSASQWHVNGDHPLDYSKTHDGLENGELRQFSPEDRRANGWEGDIVRYYRNPDDSSTRACQHCGKTMHVHGWIDTKEGGHIVCPGDWIITGVQGEHYPCKPDIFAATYEPADTPPASAQDDAKDEREAFEAWAKKKKMPLARVGQQYDDFWVDHAWNGWQARASVAAPAAGDGRAVNIEAAAKALAECMDYPWAHMPERGRATMREHAQTVIRAASQQQEG